MSEKTSTRQVRFGPYSADLESGELRKYGVRIPLQVQPFQILKLFLERPNELITREELQRKIWASNTFVDFEQGLNKAINKLRVALCDTAEDPAFIETVPKRGYRFISPVEHDSTAVESPEATDVPMRVAMPSAQPAFWRRRGIQGFALAFMVVALVAVFVYLKQPEARSTQDLRSIAVLPFVASGNGSEYDVADGLTDGLINDLSLVPNLTVISHASVFQYRGQSPDPASVGEKLGVAAVLTGRIEQNENRLFLTLELTATKDRRRLWGQQYTRNLSDRARLLHQIAGELADVLRLKLSAARREQIAGQSTSDPVAYQDYLKGRYYFFKETPEDVLRARRLFEEAIDRDPLFALAYSALGDTYDWMATEGIQPLSEVAPQAIAAKSKANQLNSSLAEVHASLASLEFVQWNWPNAELEFQKAIQINPNYFEAHRLYSIYLRSMRRFPEAIAHARLCNELNPLLMPAKSHLALTYYYAGQNEAAAEQYRLILKDNPATPSAHAGLASVLLKMGKENEAVQEWRSAVSLIDGQAEAEKLVKAYRRKGIRAVQQEFLLAELKQLDESSKTSYVSPLEYAYRYAMLNDKDKAFAWLEKAFEERTPQLFNLNVDPDFLNLRGDPRFASLLAQLHLPE